MKKNRRTGGKKFKVKKGLNNRIGKKRKMQRDALESNVLPATLRRGCLRKRKGTGDGI